MDKEAAHWHLFPLIMPQLHTAEDSNLNRCWSGMCDQETLKSPKKKKKISNKANDHPLRQMLVSPACAICVSSNPVSPRGASSIWPPCYIPLLQEVIYGLCARQKKSLKGCRSGSHIEKDNLIIESVFLQWFDNILFIIVVVVGRSVEERPEWDMASRRAISLSFQLLDTGHTFCVLNPPKKSHMEISTDYFWSSFILYPSWRVYMCYVLIPT